MKKKKAKAGKSGRKGDAPAFWPGLAECSLPDTTEALVVTDTDWTIQRVNRAFTRITGHDSADACGRPLPALLPAEPAADLFPALAAEVAAWGTWSGAIRGRRQDGSAYPGELAVSPIADATGSIAGYLLTHSDLSRRQSEEDLIRHLSRHDPLTGLPNWEWLQELLAHTLAAAGPEEEVALVLVGVDRFRTINEGLGHHVGDYVLQALAERVVRHAGPDALVARRGGDEFCVVLPPGRARDAAALAPGLLAAIAEPLSCFGQEYGLTASAGISYYPRDAVTAAALLRYADVATDHAKQSGRNTCRFFSPAMRAAVDERLLLEKGLRQAVERGQMRLHYQPLVDLSQERIAGVEALVRWQHPELGLVPPNRFIPLAEETSCIAAIGEWVLRQACRQGRRWHQDGHQHLQVAVNLSPLQFRQHQFPARVTAILAETGFDPSCLDLEITESAIMQEPEQAAAILRQLKRSRIHISVDDFGTGHSSLAYLKHFPIDRLKIDKSFVRDCPGNRQDAAIVDTIIRLARNLGLGVVAEGVEDRAQLQFLRQRQCDLVQGYLFSPPRPAEQMAALLAGGLALPPRGTRRRGWATGGPVGRCGARRSKPICRSSTISCASFWTPSPTPCSTRTSTAATWAATRPSRPAPASAARS